ncbi:hypothetical protein [Nitratireductor thuwali]
MSQSFDASRSLATLEQDNMIVVVIEMSHAKWLLAALVPGIHRQPLKKLGADAETLLKLLQCWRDEANRAGRSIKRIVVAYEAGRDGFWLPRWLRTRGVEAYVMHPACVAVSREHRRAKTDRLDTELFGGRTASGRAWSRRRHGSSTGSRRSSPASAFAPSSRPCARPQTGSRPPHGGRDAVAGQHARGAAPLA